MFRAIIKLKLTGLLCNTEQFKTPSQNDKKIIQPQYKRNVIDNTFMIASR